MKCGHLEAVRLLVKAQANLDAQDRSGKTASHIACFRASGDARFNTMAEVLIMAGANVHIMDEHRCWLFGFSV